MQRAFAQFRQTAALSLPPEAGTALLLEELHQLIPSAFNRCGFANAEFQITHGYSENPDIYQFFDRYFREIDGHVDYWPTVSEVLQRGAGVGYYLPYQTSTYYRSQYYHDIEKKVGSYHQLDATISDDRRVYGNIVLSRPRGQPFTPDECHLLERLIPFFAHAMSTAAEPLSLGAYSHTSVSVVLVDQRGKLQYTDSQGLRHLWMLCHTEPSRSNIVTKAMNQSREIRKVVQRLAALEREQDGAPPSLVITNTWGKFALRAERMIGTGSNASLVRILIEYFEPSLSALHRKLRRNSLSAQQYRVCELLLQGLSQPQIGAALGVRSTTVNEYVQSLYAKLDVHNRHALIQKLAAD